MRVRGTVHVKNLLGLPYKPEDAAKRRAGKRWLNSDLNATGASTLWTADDEKHHGSSLPALKLGTVGERAR